MQSHAQGQRQLQLQARYDLQAPLQFCLTNLHAQPTSSLIQTKNGAQSSPKPDARKAEPETRSPSPTPKSNAPPSLDLEAEFNCKFGAQPQSPASTACEFESNSNRAQYLRNMLIPILNSSPNPNHKPDARKAEPQSKSMGPRYAPNTHTHTHPTLTANPNVNSNSNPIL